MLYSLRRQLNIYAAFAAMQPKLQLAYSAWAWTEFIAQIIAMTIFVFFWRAVYANTDSLSGLSLQQTLNYILLAQIIAPLIQARVVFQFGFLIQNGQIGVELTRPVDFQLRNLVEALAGLVVYAIQKIPLFTIAVIFYGLQLPTDPITWLAFTLTIVLGSTVTFYFDWMFGCLAFYTTETWGLSVVRNGIATFFSGYLIPIAMMPTWLQQLASAMPFAQGVYVPVSLLSRIVSVDDLPQILLTQIAWLVGMMILSRIVFNIAIRKVTVQGG
ncbi:MAG: ABC-2 family transporter protein [Chloroflexi bacterium]|nr:ABC-2 family transporter protein [Chloroflexota bacterium]